MRRRAVALKLLAWFIPVGLFILWLVATNFNLVSTTLIPTPQQTLASLALLALSGELFHQVAVSLSRLLSGFVVGSAVGIALGAVAGFSKLANGILSPPMQFFSPVPPIVLTPLLILFFGIGELSKISLIAIGVAPILFLSTLQGIQSTDVKLVELARTLKKANGDIFKSIFMPSATPYIIGGLRIALGLSWMLLIASEIVAASSGIGWFVWDSRNFSRTDDAIAGIIVISVLGKASDDVLAVLERNATRWRKTFSGS